MQGQEAQSISHPHRSPRETRESPKTSATADWRVQHLCGYKKNNKTPWRLFGSSLMSAIRRTRTSSRGTPAQGWTKTTDDALVKKSRCQVFRSTSVREKTPVTRTQIRKATTRWNSPTARRTSHSQETGWRGNIEILEAFAELGAATPMTRADCHISW